MTGIDRYDDKRKRAVRRRNHIARDLADRKYRQRVKGKPKPPVPEIKYSDYFDEMEDYS